MNKRLVSLLLLVAIVAATGVWFGRGYLPGLRSKPQAGKTGTNAVSMAKAGPRPAPASGVRPGQPTNLPPGQARPMMRATNPPAIGNRMMPAPKAPGPQPPGSRTNLAVAAKGAPASTNAAAGWLNTLKSLPQSKALYPTVVVIVVCLLLLLLWRSSKTRKAQAQAGTGTGKTAFRTSNAPIHACNVLEVGPEARQVWQFDSRGGAFVLGREQTSLTGERLPGHLVAKDWRGLFQRKLNVAWLPPEHVFLRVVQLPRSNFDETLSMVELQLEKLSPMPVTQAVWSFHVLPHAEGNLQTVVVLVASRNMVEEFLGKLETDGYLADRLELPLLDQIQSTAITEDGAWIYPQTTGARNTAVVAWWYGGVLQNLDFLTLPPPELRAEGLKEQLTQMAWAGELEGWLTAPPSWHLVADVAAPEWEPALRAGLEQPVEVEPPLAPSKLAALTAKRSAQTDPRANLMPAEFITRYQQQFVDRLWMRGLLALAGLYVIGVSIYLIAVGYLSYNTGSIEKEVVRLGSTYTNAIQYKARFQVLKDRQELKYAGLDCWNAAAKLMPESVTLDSLNFSEGRRVSLSGTAASDQIQTLLNFEKDMRKYTVNGQPLFDPNKGESVQFRVQGPTANWNFSLELKRAEAP